MEKRTCGRRRLAGDLGDVASNSLPRAATARGRPPGGVAARAARDGGNRPSTMEIDRRRPILVLPPGSGRSAYRSAAGPVCTGRYGSYRSVRKTLQETQ
ncbi:hypothetical protein GW17_00015243 [Ensete ventricosum]|nr:hypothetical protein GW17_00015243 [Ensete ventricosum]